MIRHYRWQPDTCGCHINEVHDDATDEWSAEETFVNPRGEVFHTIRCPAHALITDANELYGVLHKNPDGENRRKNLLEGFLKEHPQMGAMLAVSNATEFALEFVGMGKDRVLRVRFDGASPAHRLEIEAYCKKAFGEKRVEVV